MNILLPLKQCLAILLLAVHLFNLAGYTLLFEYFMQQSDKQLTQQLDNSQYNDSGLIEVKIVLHAPYLTSWSAYERIDGEVEVNGVFYNYVKRKVHNDTLYLLCLANKNKTQLHSARLAYAANVNDVPTQAKDTGAFKKNPAGFEYQQPVQLFTVALLLNATGEKAQQPAPPVVLPYINAPFHPPQG
ncbi:hypothetical protein A4H97_19310 [Niastella yeongjuensis]|uniref:Uncharacterized protein n=1 Tax=Niastella yeongjuensis TaxID=354355 RepID=A0A1V9DYH8_9BACT|nr:hypothetical protein [Niastella yeongjuensis]OQP38859.1 hypothetical protein A4H97_19310 [Niastella yeongjuensis]SEO29953.1 hypothetical protein SAMN05660816_02540 [Niastella yeongjuensis]